uniref:BHLH domain-containing protein n=1 Tax=Triticum urartu TaxID=4572 RepID=A0A8R7QKJ0_TRIUA
MDMSVGACGDLYELAWKGGGITISSCLRRPEVLHVPPSEDEMATWLYPIITVGGQDRVGDDDDVAEQRSDNRVITSEDSNKLLKEKSGKTVKHNMATDTTSDSTATRTASGGTQSQTEKRRRSKINKSLKTLQRLVPGCDDKRCSQASTLDLTIRYIK